MVNMAKPVTTRLKPLPVSSPDEQRLCPLCAGDNHCAVASGQDASQCWCMTAQFPPSLLEQTVEYAGKQCICDQCRQLFEMK
tara:strand:+ start:1029 stop:1274 length:246 start_codon:yes stop_codon:yes gene_type:complete